MLQVKMLCGLFSTYEKILDKIYSYYYEMYFLLDL